MNEYNPNNEFHVIIKIHSGEKFKAFIPFKKKVKCLFGIRPLSKIDVLWKKTGTKEIYFFDRVKSELRRI